MSLRASVKGTCTKKIGLPERATSADPRQELSHINVDVHRRSELKCVGAGSLLQPTFLIPRTIPACSTRTGRRADTGQEGGR